jgi:hypothetical protein
LSGSISRSRWRRHGRLEGVNTLLEIYQQPDEESILAETSETRKLWERGGRVTLFWGETAP